MSGGTQGTFDPHDTWNGYNFADRSTYAKDLYYESGRVFSQGAYFDVPNEVSAITIEPYWGTAAYLSDANFDCYGYETSKGVSDFGVRYVNAQSYSICGHSQKVYTSFGNALNQLSGSTVYDNAVVLVGNYHQKDSPSTGYKAFTIMSVDMDEDNEPDFSFIYNSGKQKQISPIRFDFVNVPGTAMAHKKSGTYMGIMGNHKWNGWLEVTNTAFIRFSQLEYDSEFKTTDKAPVILLGGVVEQMVSTNGVEGSVEHTTYLHVGSNVWFKMFDNGCHMDKTATKTHRIPISVTGGDYEKFYLSGYFQPDAPAYSEDAECYISGGRFDELAGSGQELIDGDVQWLIDRADINSFYGGGINDKKAITGDITVTIKNSQVDRYCGGPKFGNMVSGKTVRTTATNCTFGTFFGAGYGGTSFVRQKSFNEFGKVNYPWNSSIVTTFTSSSGANARGKYDSNLGIAINYEYEHFEGSNDKTVGRFYVNYASLSLAQTNNVISSLTNCTITKNFYGGGSLGKVAGNATSTLHNCQVHGNVFGAGFSAAVPTAEVFPASGFVSEPNYNEKTGVFKKGVFPDGVEYTWSNDKDPSTTTLDDDNHLIYTDVDLNDLGTVAGNVTLNITGNTLVEGFVDDGQSKAEVQTGGVFGGGDESKVTGTDKTVQVNIITKGTSERYIYNVLGGGNEGDVDSNVVVNIGNDSKASEVSPYILHDVYGGGALANTNKTGVSNNATAVTLTKGTVVGDVYGGGLGQKDGVNNASSDIEAMVFGPVTVNINGGTANNVFGCNNLNGAPQSTVQVDINNGTINTNVYGGGNLAAYTANSPVVNIKGGTVKQSVFGGGNQAGVGKSDGSTTTIVNVNGGTVGSDGNGLYGIYGGCNAEGTVTGPIEVTVTSNLGSSDHKLKGIYGGGLGAPTQTTGNVTVTIDKPSGDKSTAPVIYGDVYGGSARGKVNQADADPANLTKVDFKDGVLHGTLYGGGMGDADNVALVNGLTQVTVSSGSISDGIYGGCNVNGTAKGNIQVDLTNGTVGADGATADVFGGGYGNLTNTEGNVEVNVNGASVVIWGDVYGGSGFGNVNKDANNTTTVNIVNGTIKGSVYGGGLGDKESLGTGHYNYAALVKGKVYVNIGLASQVGNDATGPTIQGEIYGCNNLNGSPQDGVFVDIYHTKHNNDNKYPKDAEGNPTISMDDLNVTLETATDSTNYFKKFALAAVYGGGNQAAYTAAGKTAKVTVHECSDNTVRTIYGGGNAADATNVELFIEGGRFDRIFGGGNGYSKTGNHTEQYLPGTTTPDPNFNPGANISGTATTEIQGGLFRQIFGGSNQYGNVGEASLTISKDENCALLISESFGGANEADITGDVTTTLACSDIEIGTFYGGSNLANIIDGDVTLNVFGGHYSNVFGGSKGKTTKAANIKGDVTLNLYGGTMTNAFGGSDVNGNITGKITVNVLDYEGDCALEVANIYGGGNWTAYSPSNASALSPEVNIMHIKSGNNITGNVYGGGKGDADHDAVVTANPLVNIGYVSSMSDLIPDNYYTTTSLSADALKASVSGFVFGGGDYASVAGNTTVNIQKANSSTTSLFGGGNQASVGGATVNVISGNVSTGVYGGCNTSGSVGGNIYTYVYDPSLGTLTKADDPTNYSGTIIVNIKNDLGAAGTPLVEGIYGGGKGSATDTQGDITVTIGGTALDPTIYADVYGGSALGKVNKDANNSTSITLATGTINGNIFGGGMGQTSPTAIAAEVRGAVQMNINGGSVKGGTTGPGIYGGCNFNGTVDGAIAVNVNGGTIGTDDTHTVNVHGGGYGQSTSTGGNVEVTVNGVSAVVWGDVYGGSALGSVNGTAANTTNHTNVTLSQGTIHGDLYGGGLGSKTNNVEAWVYSPVKVNVTGGTVDKVFGCNNEKGAPKRGVKVNINKGAGDMSIGNVYGGGNEAAYTAPSDSTNHPIVNLIAGAVTNDVFGGGLGSSATVTGNPVVNIEGGTVNGRVFGGGSAAPVTGNPQVNAFYGTVPTIHGGGLGSTAVVTGNPTVVYNQTSGKTLTVTSAFGGGDAAGVTGNTDVQLKAGSLTNAFGGGNVADITGTTTVTLEGATVANIYGGGNEANVSNTATVEVKSGSATDGVYGGCNSSGSVGVVVLSLTGGTIGTDGGTTADVHGGGYGKNTTTTGNIDITLNGTNIYGDLYGGSAFGGVNASTSDITTLTIGSNTLHGTIYGGGKGDLASLNDGGATEHSDITATSNGQVLINYNTANTELAGLYGGANINGLVSGDISLNVNANVGDSDTDIDIFGGGYGAATSTGGNVTVTIGDKEGTKVPTIYGDIYGGSALGQVNDVASDKTTVNFFNGTLHGDIYGGGLGAATLNSNGYVTAVNTEAIVNGKVEVNIGGEDQDDDDCNIDLKGKVFGCNNLAGSPQDQVEVHIYRTGHNTTNAASYQGNDATFAISEVYGGGNLAHYTATDKKATVHIHNCSNTIGYVYGGGNAADATGVAVSIDGGRFDWVFGGGNGAGTGNPGANIGAGGATLNVHGGLIGHLFGGSNEKGIISGGTSVNIDHTGCDDEYIAEFFGGSNKVEM